MVTTNYDMFVFEDTNREINNGLVTRIMKSIAEIGYITARPVLVDESMTIIDGQHRFMACKQLELPIVYEISTVADKNKTMLNLNMNQLVWKIQDYIISHSKKGIACYTTLVDFERTYKLGPTNTIQICAKHISPKQLRAGEPFEVNPNRHSIANFVLRCKPYFDFYHNKQFVLSIVILYSKASKEDCEKVFDKIQSLRQQAKTVDYLVFYENILNRHKKSKDIILLTK